jgi:hypothetical protein
MTTFSAWLPLLICALILALYICVHLKKIIRLKHWFSFFGYGFLLCLASVFAVTLVWSAFFMKVVPDCCWQQKARESQTAIIFGFGFEWDDMCRMLPGASNQALYEQAMNDAGYQNLIMQQGVMVAARKDRVRTHDKNLIQMHPLNLGYVNTLAAAKYALQKMESLNVKRATVYAHDLQLARAVYDLRRIAASHPRWQDMEFITPCIPPVPFPEHSAQWHTRCKMIYLPIELFISRPLNTIQKRINN